MISFGSSIFGRTISKKSAIGTVLKKINLKKEGQVEQDKIQQNKDDNASQNTRSNFSDKDKTGLLNNRHFKIRDTLEDGNMSVRKLRGLKRDSDILFVAPPRPSFHSPNTEGDTFNYTLSNEDQNLFKVRRLIERASSFVPNISDFFFGLMY